MHFGLTINDSVPDLYIDMILHDAAFLQAQYDGPALLRKRLIKPREAQNRGVKRMDA